MSDIRACIPDDIPAIARIFQKTFRDRRRPAPFSLETCLRELFFGHPWYDPELSTRVYVAPDGNVAGFMGVVPMHMSFRGRPVRAAVPTSLAVEDPKRYPLAGAKLVRAFLSGPQEISVSEPANEVSQAMWVRLGAHMFPSESMEWLRILRPAGLALALPARNWTGLAAPVALAADLAIRKLAGERFRAPRTSAYQRDADVSADELAPCLAEFSRFYALHPEWDAHVVQFMLRHAAQNKARGTLYVRVVYGRGDTPLGCYLYHGRPGKIAFVLQILAQPNALDAVLDSLFAHADAHGSVGVKGRTELRLLEPLLRRKCLFFRRHSAMMHSRDPELVEAVASGQAITSGLAAESWMRLCADQFT
jgi:hypothetical protein